MNLSGRAFEDDDDDRELYWSRRGRGSFAVWLRSLADRERGRVVHAGSPFVLDEETAQLEGLGYGAGLLNQYVVEQELMPTYRVVADCPCPPFSFATESDELLAALARETSADEAARLRALLEDEACGLLAKVWEEWRVKRIRLSRYGAVQVVLELGKTALTTPAEFVEPVTRLGASLGAKGLAERVRPTDPGLEALRQRFLELTEVKHRKIETSVQWEIVGHILGWFIGCVHSTDDGTDELKLDPNYAAAWRERKTFTGGHKLPFRRRFLILRIDGLQVGRSRPPRLDAAMKRELAQLLDETPLVQSRLQPAAAGSNLSDQSPEYLHRVAADDRATWEQEACLLSHDAAVLVNLHEDALLLKLDRDVSYREYWLIVARAMEYVSELRLMARFLEHVSSGSLEQTMDEIMREGTMSAKLQERTVAFGAAESVLLLRLQNSASPTAISATDAVVIKLAALRDHFGIPEALKRTGANLAAAQRIVSHYERLSAQRKMVDLHIGLAGFTGVLMGLTLPTFFRDVFHEEPFKGQGMVSALGLLWTVITVAAIVRAGYEVVVHVKDSSYRVPRWLRRLLPGMPALPSQLAAGAERAEGDGSGADDA